MNIIPFPCFVLLVFLFAGCAEEKRKHTAAVNPAVATKDHPFINTLGMKFVPVKITGGPTSDKPALFSVWDTRAKDYDAYAKAKSITPEKPGFVQTEHDPVVNVSWEDAKAFCVWLTASERAEGRLTEGWEYRLPSDHEWSCAIGIGVREDAGATPKEKAGKLEGVYPWGNAWPPPNGTGNYAKSLGLDQYVFTSPAGSFPPDGNGIYDMSGNISQWCEDWYDGEQKYRVLRGGSWGVSDPLVLLSSGRDVNYPGSRLDRNGFRCVLAAAPGK